MDTITTLATVPAIIALVNLGKRLGVRGEIALALAVFLGVFLAVADHTLIHYGWYQAAADGLILGLAAAGLYDVTSPHATTDTEHPDALPQ